VTKRVRMYRKDMQQLTLRERIRYLISKGFSFVGSAPVKNRLKAAQRELNQIEVYRANLLALDRYHRKSLRGRLRALEIFEAVQGLGDRDPKEGIDWSAFWSGETRLHYADGKNSGDMLTSKNAPVIADLLVARLQATRDSGTIPHENLLDGDRDAAVRRGRM